MTDDDPRNPPRSPRPGHDQRLDNANGNAPLAVPGKRTLVPPAQAHTPAGTSAGQTVDDRSNRERNGQRDIDDPWRRAPYLEQARAMRPSGDRADHDTARDGGLGTSTHEPSGSGPVGDRIQFGVGDEVHTQYIDDDGVPMMASTPTPVAEKVQDARAKLAGQPPLVQQRVEPELTLATRLVSTASEQAIEAKAGDPAAKAALRGTQEALGNSLGTISRHVGTEPNSQPRPPMLAQGTGAAPTATALPAPTAAPAAAAPTATTAPSSAAGPKPEPQDDPVTPPAVGKYKLSITSDGLLVFTFNSTDARAWNEPLYAAVTFYMERVFPGVTPAIIKEALHAQGFEFEGGFHRPAQDNSAYLVSLRQKAHLDMKTWMREHYPRIKIDEPRIETGDLGRGSGGGGAGGAAEQKKKGGGETSKGDAELEDSGGTGQSSLAPGDVERARALYERLRKLFPDSDAWQSTTVYPEFLQFLADHAEKLKQIPKSKKGVSATSVADLKKLLEAFEKHQLDSENGDASGDVGGDAASKPGGSHDGDKAGDTTGEVAGKEGGSQYGQIGGSKNGTIKWDPKGDIAVRPSLDTYVAGSELNVEMKWDPAVHPRSGLLLLANHCSYVWKSKQNGKVVDRDGNSIFANDRHTSLRLGKAAGEVEIEVTAKSKHFTTKTFTTAIKVNVISEKDYDKATFDSKHVGKDKAFARDDQGKLSANANQKALTVDDEISSTDIAKGGIDELRKQGKISDTDHEVLAERSTNQRAALLEIKEKVKAGTPYLVRGTFVSREDSQAFELKLLMHMRNQSQKNELAFYDLILHDLTMGGATQHPGSSWGFLQDERPATVFRRLEDEALERMADHFHAHNDYPKGTIHLAAQRLTDGKVWEDTRDTNNWRKKGKKALGTVAMIGGAALLVVPGGGALSVGLMVVSGGAGAASVALEIEDRIAKEGKLKLDRRLVLDVLQLASTVLAFGTLSTALKEASAVAKSRYVLSMVNVDAAQGFLIGLETRDALQVIDAETAVKLARATSDDEKQQILAERDRQAAEVIGGAIVSGSFMLVSLGGGIKQVMATSRAGKQFAVREPVKQLGERGAAEIQDAIANQRFVHENRAVVLTEAESQFLESQMLSKSTKPGSDGAAPVSETKQPTPEEQKPVHERTTQQMPAVDPEAKATNEESKPSHERTTQQMPAVDPAQLPGHQPTQVTFTGKGDALGAAAKSVTPEPGYFDVVVHGDAGSFYVLHNGTWVPVKPNSVRQHVARHPGYHGQPIRLISCEAGAAGDGIAKAMANGLGVNVKAPVETVWINTENGQLIVGTDPAKPNASGWRDFKPYKAGDAVANPTDGAPPVETPVTPARNSRRAEDEKVGTSNAEREAHPDPRSAAEETAPEVRVGMRPREGEGADPAIKSPTRGEQVPPHERPTQPRPAAESDASHATGDRGDAQQSIENRAEDASVRPRMDADNERLRTADDQETRGRAKSEPEAQSNAEPVTPIPVDEQPAPETDPDVPRPWLEGDNPARYQRYKVNVGRRNAKKAEAARRETLDEQDWWDTYGHKEPNNPGGGEGAPDHRAKVAELERKARADYPDLTRYEVRRNQKVPGLNQKPDAAVIDVQTGKVVKVYEAARFTKGGKLVRADEVAKIVDYDAAGVAYEFHPVGPNKPPGGVLTSPPSPVTPKAP